MSSLYRSIGPGLVCAWIALVAAGPAQALDVVVPNFNFEANARPDGVLASGVLDGWQVTGNWVSFGTYNPNQSYYGTPLIADTAFPSNGSGVIGTMNGPNLAYIFGPTVAGAFITAATSHGVVAGETYVLTVAIGQRFGPPNQQTYSPVTLSLLDGDSTLSSTVITAPPAAGTFGDASLIYTAQAGDSGNLRIRLGIASGQYADFDNVRLTVSPVPEPSSVAAMVLGLTVLGLRRRLAR